MAISAEHPIIQLLNALVVPLIEFDICRVVLTYTICLIDRSSLPINIKILDQCRSISNFGFKSNRDSHTITSHIILTAGRRVESGA